MKQLNTFLADIEKGLRRHSNTLCLWVNISTPIHSPLRLWFKVNLSSLGKWFSNNWILPNVSKRCSGTTPREEIPSDSQLKLSKFQCIKPPKKVIIKVIFKWVMIVMGSLFGSFCLSSFGDSLKVLKLISKNNYNSIIIQCELSSDRLGIKTKL